MTEDRTLEEFLSAGDPSDADDEAEAGEGRGATDESPDDGSGSGEAVAPATPTYGWGEYTCNECGTATERVWQGTDGAVCDGCKEW